MPPRYYGRRPITIPAYEHYVTFRLLEPLPFMVVFPSVSLRLWIQVHDYRPFVVLRINDQPWKGIRDFENPTEATHYLSGPLDFKSPSQLETVFFRLVREHRAETLRHRHSRLRLVCPVADQALCGVEHAWGAAMRLPPLSHRFETV